MNKTPTGFKPLERHCVDCGKTFIAKQWNAERCLVCRKKRKHAQSLARSQKHIDMRYRINRESAKSIPKIDDSSINRCLYCGCKIDPDSFFCKNCRAEGFDNVYIVTNKSNGWEKRRVKHNVVHVSPGWRGQRVGGCLAPVNREKYAVAI